MRSHLILAAMLSVVFAVATAIVAVAAHHGGSSEAGPSGAAPSGTASDRPVQINGGPTELPTLCCPPAPHPLHAHAINRAFQAYMDALLHRDLPALERATCPRLRHTEVGVALHGKYVRAWSGKPYDIEPGIYFVTVRALVKFTDPANGNSAGRAVYAWNVERGNGGRYYVCGFLS